MSLLKTINMKITSKNLKGGLYGQLLLWPLELLPYLKENDINPTWKVQSEFYGIPPDYNIFGTHIISNKKENETHTRSFDLLKLKINNPKIFTNFKGDFYRANELFFEFFSFSDEIIKEVDDAMAEFDNKKTLGLHYRGTDKINTEGGYVNLEIFKKTTDDYLKNNKIDAILIFSDEVAVSNELEKYYSDNYSVKNFNEQESQNLVFNRNNVNSTPNDVLYQKTILDSIILSKCGAVIKTASQFSGWAKIFNPELTIYRASAFKENWFPDFYIPPYKSSDAEVAKMLDTVFINENKTIKT